MGIRFDSAWAEEVCAVCDPVFESADVGLAIGERMARLLRVSSPLA